MPYTGLQSCQSVIIVLHSTTVLSYDAMCLHYNWHPPQLPNHCVCDRSFNTDHALSFPTGGFPFVRRNDLRDFIANLCTEVCPNVCIEPPLPALTGNCYHMTLQWAFFDVRVYHPNALSYQNTVTISIPSS